MEHHANTHRLTSVAEVDAALRALVSYEASSTPHISDDDKAHAEQLRTQLLETAPALSDADITFLAGVAKYMLGTPHHVAEKQRQAAGPLTLEAAQAIADINKPLTAK